MHITLTSDEVAQWLKIPPATLRFWRYRGTGPRYWYAGRRVVYSQADVEQWIDEQRAKSVPTK